MMEPEEDRMQPRMFLTGVEDREPEGHEAPVIGGLRAAGLPVPQIMHLFAYKPERTRHLAEFTHEVMRGPSPLSPGFRELIAAYTSALNQCVF
jgi:alkylhydroperoxidase family enzyme